MCKRTYTAALLLLAGFCILPARNVRDRINDIVAAAPGFGGASVAVMAVTADGEVIADVDASRKMLPASNMKLVTTGTALHLLGPGYRYSTALAIDGPVQDGELKGNLYVIGGGDPTLAGKDTLVLPPDRLFGEWCRLLADRGIRRISGKVIADGSAFDGMRDHPAWLWEDIGTYYGAGGSALIYADNELRFSVSPGPSAGDAVKIRQLPPMTPWLDFRSECTTGRSGTGDRLYLYTADFSDVAVMRGTFALDRKPKTVLCANKRPELTCASDFVAYMNAHGIGGGTAEGAPEGCDCGKLEPLGETFSPDLGKIVRVTNRDSNNLFAETLFRTVGRELTGSACYDSSAVAVRRLLKQMGVDSGTVTIVDGSGLSRKNYLSPAFLCNFLLAMTKSVVWPDFLESLPKPGCAGTLKYAFRSLPREVRERLYLKSGSMEGVLCYSGYYISESGQITALSLMLNDSSASASELRTLAEKILSAVLESAA